MSRWFRFYDDTLNDPKSLKLSDKTFRIWVGMLCAASKNDGILPPFDDLVILLRIKAEKLQPEIEKLIAAELIDHDDGGLHPHNWNARQYKSDVSTDRVKRFRNAERNVSVTPPETETEQKDAGADAPPSDESDLFRRGKLVLGPTSGGLLAKLLKSKKGSVPLARAAIEQAATKSDAREYIGRIIAGPGPPIKVLSPFGTEYPDGIL